MTLLKVDSLSVNYGRKRPVHAVRDVSIVIEDGEFIGLVGESGCGKSTLGYAIARLESSPAYITAGRIEIDGRAWTGADEDDLRVRRWTDLAVVLQSGMNALNPVMSIRAQFRDVMAQHTHMSAKEIQSRSEEVLSMVNIPVAALSRYPHELSGGMRQRVAIAMALLLRPKLIIMDEPTTALDMVVQRQIVENLRRLRQQQSFAVLFISHDLGLVLELSDRVLVMYAGEIVEDQPAANLLAHPLHPYTRALIASLPNPQHPSATLFSIAGTPPDLHTIPPGCAFAPRCPMAEPTCRIGASPPLEIVLADTHLAGKVRCPITVREVSVNG